MVPSSATRRRAPDVDPGRRRDRSGFSALKLALPCLNSEVCARHGHAKQPLTQPGRLRAYTLDTRSTGSPSSDRFCFKSLATMHGRSDAFSRCRSRISRGPADSRTLWVPFVRQIRQRTLTNANRGPIFLE